MKAIMSVFLQSRKALLRKLVSALENQFSYVSVLGTDTFGTVFRIQKSSTAIEDSSWNERGFVLRAHNGINYSEFSFNDISEDNLEHLISKITESLTKSIDSLKDSVQINKYPVIQEENITKSFIGEVKIHPSSVSAEEKLNRFLNIHKEGMKLSDKLIDFRISYTELEISKIFISSKKDLEQAYIISEGAMIPIVRHNDDTKYSFSGYSGVKGVELIDELENGLSEAVNSAVELLDAEPVKPGLYDVVCTPEVTGVIVHEAFGHGVEMDMFVKERAKAVEYINKPVASELVTMRDGAASAVNVSSYLFDDEGTIASDTIIIDKGILKTGMSDLLSAMKLGTKPTGNGKRQSFERKAYTRMTNTFFTSGTDTAQDMISSIKHGYLLDGIMSGMEDPKNWGIQCMLLKGKEIIDGKFTGKIVSPVILTGYVPDLLKSISMISGDVELFGGGACGKGYKEYVKVSDGGPYIKAKARLG